MKVLFCLWCFISTFFSGTAQTEPAAPILEQQLENITENNEDVEPEDDSFLQQMQYFLKNPIHINSVNEATLEELKILTPLQLQQFFLYRKLLGKLIHAYELQAIPGWDIRTIQKIRPYITIDAEFSLKATMRQRLLGGEHYVLARGTQVLEKAKGYRVDSGAVNFYPGSPQRFLFRYKYAYKNLLQYGVLAEKDPGEQFFKGMQKQGFDFYSFHIFLKNIGIVQTLAIGDFTVNLGQGLVQWQNMAFQKGIDMVNMKRSAFVLNPYHSTRESNFHRGAGITLGKKHWQITVFGSYKKIDGNIIVDSFLQVNTVSSLPVSGYHRTRSETEDKNMQGQLSYGGNFSYRHNRLHVGINAIRYNFKLSFKKSNEPYNMYAPSGKSFGNYSFDYGYTYKNIHVFGEVAFTHKLSKAFVNGIIISTSSSTDIGIFYRNISPAYQSFSSSAFTQNTFPVNEKGLFMGIALRPSGYWHINIYADFYKFPWLKFRINRPAEGSEYGLQATYKPNKQLEIYSRYRVESRPANSDSEPLGVVPVLPQPRKNWRIQFSYNISSSMTLRSRVELVWVNKKGIQAEQGFLTYFDFLFKSVKSPLSAGLRLQYFETDSYNTRIYAFENDVLYSFSIPSFYDKGYRYYLNIKYEAGKKLSLWAKWTQTIYRDKIFIGSGLDEIGGNKKSELKMQVLYKF